MTDETGTFPSFPENMWNFWVHKKFIGNSGGERDVGRDGDKQGQDTPVRFLKKG
jgi:hypothetical protein